MIFWSKIVEINIKMAYFIIHWNDFQTTVWFTQHATCSDYVKITHFFDVTTVCGRIKYFNTGRMSSELDCIFKIRISVSWFDQLDAMELILELLIRYSIYVWFNLDLEFEWSRLMMNDHEWSWMILNVDEQDGPLLFM